MCLILIICMLQNCVYINHISQIGLKIGVRQRGCNGLSYTLDYATKKGLLLLIIIDNSMNRSIQVALFCRSYGRGSSTRRNTSYHR